jgi:hypothetical protein
MKRNSRIKLVLCLAFVVLFATSAFTTAGPQDDKVVFGGSYVLSDGETLTGNLVILGGNVTLEQGSIVNGDAALVGGTLDAGGTIQGNLTIVGGAAHLGEHAVIDQNVFTIGGNLTRATGSQISGNVTNFAGAPFNLTIPGVPVSPTVPVVPLVQSTTSLLWKMIYFMAMVIVSSALAMLIALLWARPTQRVANAIRTNPIGTGGFGCLTLIVAPGLLILVAITIILSPLSLLGLLLLAASVMFGWAAINLEVGNRLAKLFKVTWSAPIAAGIGALLFNLVVFGFAMVPCFGWALVTLVVLFALGGVLITRFGSHEYPEVPAVRPVSAVPAAPVLPAAIQTAPKYPEVVKPVAKPAQKPAAKSTAKPAVIAAKTPAKPTAKPTAKAKIATPKAKPAAKTASKKPAGTKKTK